MYCCFDNAIVVFDRLKVLENYLRMAYWIGFPSLTVWVQACKIQIPDFLTLFSFVVQLVHVGLPLKRLSRGINRFGCMYLPRKATAAGLSSLIRFHLNSHTTSTFNPYVFLRVSTLSSKRFLKTVYGIFDNGCVAFRVVATCVSVVHTAIKFESYSPPVFFIITIHIIFAHHHLAVGQSMVYVHISGFLDKF